jgi:hypothetical protein
MARAVAGGGLQPLPNVFLVNVKSGLQNHSCSRLRRFRNLPTLSLRLFKMGWSVMCRKFI